jgi:hypothetical protein
MNVLIRGVRFAMRLGRTNCVKGVLEPKADSTDTNDLFYAGDADPDRVELHRSLTPSTSFLLENTDAGLQITDEEIKQFIHAHCAAAFHPVRCPFPIVYLLPAVSSHLLNFFFADVDRAHRRLFRDRSRRSAPARIWRQKPPRRRCFYFPEPA